MTEILCAVPQAHRSDRLVDGQPCLAPVLCIAAREALFTGVSPEITGPLSENICGALATAILVGRQRVEACEVSS